MATTLISTDFNFPGQTAVYHGKVRDVYTIGSDLLVMIATDRISAFDVILPQGIPYKGQVLNQIAEYFLDSTADIVPNWKLASPDPMATVGLRCRRIQSRDDYPWLPHRKRMARIQNRLPRDMRCEAA